MAPYVAPLWPAGHLPRKGGDHARRRRRSSSSITDWRKLSGQLISPLAGEMAGTPEGGNVGRFPTCAELGRSEGRTYGGGCHGCHGEEGQQYQHANFS